MITKILEPIALERQIEDAIDGESAQTKKAVAERIAFIRNYAPYIVKINGNKVVGYVRIGGIGGDEIFYRLRKGDVDYHCPIKYARIEFQFDDSMGKIVQKGGETAPDLGQWFLEAETPEEAIEEWFARLYQHDHLPAGLFRRDYILNPLAVGLRRVDSVESTPSVYEITFTRDDSKLFVLIEQRLIDCDGYGETLELCRQITPIPENALESKLAEARAAARQIAAPYLIETGTPSENGQYLVRLRNADGEFWAVREFLGRYWMLEESDGEAEALFWQALPERN